MARRKSKYKNLKLRGRIWHIKYKDENGKLNWHTSGTEDEDEAEEIRAERSKLCRQVREKLLPPEVLKDPFDFQKAVDAWIDALKVGEKDERYIESCRRILGELSDLTADEVNKYLKDAREEDVWGTTLYTRLRIIRVFDNWCVDNGKLERPRIAGIRLRKGKKKRERRWLKPEEWKELERWLFSEVCEKSDRKLKFPPRRRLIFWRTAIETGYRSCEVQKLKKDSLRRVGNVWMLILESKHIAKKSSECQPGKQSISEELALLIKKEFLGDRRRVVIKGLEEDILFDVPQYNYPEMVRKDLEDAKIWTNVLHVTSKGKVSKSTIKDVEKVDFHSLRRTCGAFLLLGGENVKTVQAVMRHATSSMTLDTYVTLLEEDYQSVAANTMGKVMG